MKIANDTEQITELKRLRRDTIDIQSRYIKLLVQDDFKKLATPLQQRFKLFIYEIDQAIHYLKGP